jgi:hypothetical protein
MSTDWKEAKERLEEFERMMEEIDEYLPETEEYDFNDGPEWECQKQQP